MELDYEYYSQEGMEREIGEWLRKFREDIPDTIMAQVPMYLHECSFEKRSLTVYIDPTPWMADRIGGMSNGTFSVALDETMGVLTIYFANSMPPTITMQMSLLRPISLDKRLYIRANLVGEGGSKDDLTAQAWSEGMEDQPVCSATGIYYTGNPSFGKSAAEIVWR